MENRNSVNQVLDTPDPPNISEASGEPTANSASSALRPPTSPA